MRVCNRATLAVQLNLPCLANKPSPQAQVRRLLNLLTIRRFAASGTLSACGAARPRRLSPLIWAATGRMRPRATTQRAARGTTLVVRRSHVVAICWGARAGNLSVAVPLLVRPMCAACTPRYAAAMSPYPAVMPGCTCVVMDADFTATPAPLYVQWRGSLAPYWPSCWPCPTGRPSRPA